MVFFLQVEQQLIDDQDVMSWYCCNISVLSVFSCYYIYGVGRKLMCCVMLNASRMSHTAFASVSSSLLR